MSEILGLSHIIFSSPNKILPENSFLRKVYDRPEFYKFDHSAAKKNLLRKPGFTETQLTLYNSVKSNLPSIELILSDSEIKKPAGSYGLIFSEDILPEQTNDTGNLSGLNIKEFFPFEKIVYSEEIPSMMVASAELAKFACTMGAWITVDSLERADKFYSVVLGAEKVKSGEKFAYYRTKVVNRFFSKFLFVLIESADKNKNWFNDDIGLAAFGWFAKKQPEIPDTFKNEIRNSPEFDIKIKNNIFKAKFLYDNKSPSHEIMVLQAKGFNG